MSTCCQARSCSYGGAAAPRPGFTPAWRDRGQNAGGRGRVSKRHANARMSAIQSTSVLDASKVSIGNMSSATWVLGLRQGLSSGVRMWHKHLRPDWCVLPRREVCKQHEAALTNCPPTLC